MKNKKRDSSFFNLAKKIDAIHTGIEDLKKHGLNDRAIMVLLQDATKLPRKQIIQITDAIKNLEKLYCEGVASGKRKTEQTS